MQSRLASTVSGRLPRPSFSAILAGVLLLASLSVPAQIPPAQPSKPELVLQTGHSVKRLAFTQDDRLLVSGSADGTIKVWETATGRLLRTVFVNKAVDDMVVSPDGRWFATSDIYGRVILWDLATGSRVRVLIEYAESSEVLAVSPDGRLLASGGQDNMVKIWDTASGKNLVRIKAHKDSIAALSFSPDGTLLASGSADRTVKIWEVGTGNLRGRLSEGAIRKSAGKAAKVYTVRFMPHGLRLMLSDIGGSDLLWDLTSKKLSLIHPGKYDDASEIISDFSISQDESLLATTDFYEIAVWALPQGKEILRFRDEGSKTVAISARADLLAVGGWHGIELFSLPAGSKVRSFGPDLGRVDSVSFSHDGRWLAVAQNQALKLWDLNAGGMRLLRGHKRTMTAAAFSSQADILASAAIDQSEIIWDVATGHPTRTLRQRKESASTLALSPDGTWLALGTDHQLVQVWNTRTGTEPLKLAGHRHMLQAVAVSPNGRWVASSSFDKTIRIWDVSTGQTVLFRDTKIIANLAVAFSPDGRWLACGVGREVQLWDVGGNREIHRLGEHDNAVSALAFSSDGRQLLSGSYDQTLRLWDVATGKRLRSFLGHTSLVFSVSISPDERYIASGSLDGTTRIWDIGTGEELADLISIGDTGDWLVVTPDGLFDGSPSAWNQLLWRFNGNTFDVAPVELFFREFYHPGLLADILAGKRPKAATDIANIDRRQPEVRLSAAGISMDVPVSARKIRLMLELAEAPPDDAHKEAGSGLRDVRLFRNGSLVKVWRGDIPLDKSGKATLTADDVTLVAGENRLTAYAFSKSDIKSTDATLTLTGADSLKRRGTAYILAVGINRYSDEKFNLNFAVPDAQDFAQTLQADQAKLARYSEIRVVPLTDAEATKENILSALRCLAGTDSGPRRANQPAALAQLQPAQPEDAVFVYYAGHGAAPHRASKRFYLVAHDFQLPAEGTAASSETLPGTVNDLELGAAMEKIDAGELVLVIDACQSGKTLESDDPRQGPMNSGGLAQLAYEKGMYILAAAQGDQAAKELSQLGHGLLTYALVEEGLKQVKADDEPQDGQIVLREWLDYTTQRLPQLQLEGMQRMASLGRDVPIVNGEDKIKELERRNLQRPRVFYRREPEATPLVIAKP